jgi:hypothetical protein
VRAWFVIALGCALSGCITAGTTPETAPSAPSVTCTAGPDCEAKWARALSWIEGNSRWKVETKADAVIETKPSINSSASPGFKATKVAGASGYEIKLTGGCASWFGCTPSVEESRAQFAKYVMSTAELPAPSGLPATPPPIAKPSGPPPSRITCQAGPDCEAKWARALAWLEANAQWDIETKNDRVIESKPSINSSSYPGFKATKVADGAGGYEIRLIGGCASWFGCTPTVEESRAQFAEYVMASAETPEPSPPPPPQPNANRKRSSS